MTRTTNVFLRGTNHVFRVQVPVDLVIRLGRREIWRSLGTNDPDIARRLGLTFALTANRLFAVIRTLAVPTKAEIDELIQTYFRRALEDDEVRRITDTPPPDWRTGPERFYLEHLGSDAEIEAAIKHSGKSASEFIEDEMLIGDADEFRHMSIRRDWSDVRVMADAFLQEQGVNLPNDGPLYRLLCQGIIRAQIEFLRIKAGRSAGDWSLQPRDPLFTGEGGHLPKTVAKISGAAAPVSGVTLKVAIDQFIAEKKRSGIREKSVAELRTALGWLTGYFDSARPIASFTRAEISEYRNALGTLVAHWTLKFKGKPLREAVLLSRDSPLPKLEISALNGKRLGPVTQLFDWAKAAGYIGEHPAQNLKFPVSRSHKRAKKRDGFSTEQLKTVFGAPLFVGAKSSGRWTKPGPVIIRDHRYWVPLLALFTGGRRTELCQLLTSDVEQREDIWTISINEVPDPDDDMAEKSVKNAESVRLIPVHPELVKFGFLDYVLARKQAQKSGPLFDCQPGSSGKYDPFGKWFGRFLDSVGIRSKRLVFHSFRHNFEQAMLDCIPEQVARFQIGGRTIRDSSADYQTGLSLSRLSEEISKVRYPGLDVSHLHSRSGA